MRLSLLMRSPGSMRFREPILGKSTLDTQYSLEYFIEHGGGVVTVVAETLGFGVV